jgi:hypothetical protein
MAKRKNKTNAPAQSGTAPQSSSHRANHSTAKPARTSANLLRKGLPWLALLMFIAGAWALSRQSPPPAKEAAFQAMAARNQCRGQPKFIAQLGFKSPSISTAERDVIGLAVTNLRPDGSREAFWQHPSWKASGALSAFAIDADGNIFVIPAPRVNLMDNPPELQNRIYKISTDDGVMSLLTEFPVAKKPDARNPFAGLGLSYDCADRALYVSSIAGSDAQTERGLVQRVVLQGAPRVETIYEGFDALSVLSVDLPNNERGLLLASARTPEVYGLRLNADGSRNVSTKAQALMSIRGIGPHGNERGRKLDVNYDDKGAVVSVRGTHFAYNLAQPSAQAKAVVYRFRWKADKYQFEDWQ